jgi:hypothetical protein
MNFEGVNHRQRLFDRQREQNLEKQRNAEYARENLQKALSKQSIYITAAEMDDNIEFRRRKLDMEAIAREEALEAMTRTAAGEARRRQFEQTQENALAQELEATRREEESRRMEIQRICEADPGLRELQVRFKGLSLPFLPISIYFFSPAPLTPTNRLLQTPLRRTRAHAEQAEDGVHTERAGGAVGGEGGDEGPRPQRAAADGCRHGQGPCAGPGFGVHGFCGPDRSARAR